MLERKSLIFICIISSVIFLSACSNNESSVNTTNASIKQPIQTPTSTPIKSYISQDVALDWEVISRANLILGTVEELDMSGNILTGIKLKAENYIQGTSPSDSSPIELGKSIYLKVNKAELKKSQKSYLTIGNQVILLVAQYIIGQENWFWGTGAERFFYKKNNDFYDSVDNSKFPFEVSPASHIGVEDITVK